jgi:hypothetical protein
MRPPQSRQLPSSQPAACPPAEAGGPVHLMRDDIIQHAMAAQALLDSGQVADAEQLHDLVARRYELLPAELERQLGHLIGGQLARVYAQVHYAIVAPEQADPAELAGLAAELTAFLVETLAILQQMTLH